MKIRKLILLSILNLFFWSSDAISKDQFSDDFTGKRIFPKERVEKRVYDSSRPDIVVWHTEAEKPDYPGAPSTRTMGFVEAAAEEKKILCINGFLVQRQHITDVEKGFFLQFRTDFIYLSLPRRVLGKNIKYQDRYAFNELLSETFNDGMQAGLLKIDYRNIRLIENGKIYHPQKKIVEELNSYGGLKDSPPLLMDIRKADVIPGKNEKNKSVLYLNEVLYFEIDHIPLNFKIEVPSVLINGVEVPFPTFYFEPYNTVTHEGDL